MHSDWLKFQRKTRLWHFGPGAPALEKCWSAHHPGPPETSHHQRRDLREMLPRYADWQDVTPKQQGKGKGKELLVVSCPA